MKKGLSLLEIVIVIAIVAALSLAAVPVGETLYIKAQEDALMLALQNIRGAIARWNLDSINTLVRVQGQSALNEVDWATLYPPALEDLVSSGGKGYPIRWKGASESDPLAATFYPLPYLSAIPSDPFVGEARWKLHYLKILESGSYSPVTNKSEGPSSAPSIKGVFDVSCVDNPEIRRGFVIALDGTKYEDW